MNKDLKARIASAKAQKKANKTKTATAATFKDKLNKLLANFVVQPTKDGTGGSYLIVANEDGKIVSAGYYDNQLAVQSTIQLLSLICYVIDEDGEPRTHLSPEKFSSMLIDLIGAGNRALKTTKSTDDVDNTDESTLH